MHIVRLLFSTAPNFQFVGSRSLTALIVTRARARPGPPGGPGAAGGARRQGQGPHGDLLGPMTPPFPPGRSLARAQLCLPPPRSPPAPNQWPRHQRSRPATLAERHRRRRRRRPLSRPGPDLGRHARWAGAGGSRTVGRHPLGPQAGWSSVNVGDAARDCRC